jgi:hypothetical protein
MRNTVLARANLDLVPATEIPRVCETSCPERPSISFI